MPTNPPLFRRTRLFLLELRERFLAPDLPLAITEILSVPPGGVETYHLPLGRGAVLNVEINAAAPLHIRLLDEETWRAARTLDARLNASSRYFATCGRTTQLQFVAPRSGGYMLLLCNPATTANDALLALSSELSPRLHAAGESVSPMVSSAPALAALARLFSFRD